MPRLSAALVDLRYREKSSLDVPLMDTVAPLLAVPVACRDASLESDVNRGRYYPIVSKGHFYRRRTIALVVVFIDRAHFVAVLLALLNVFIAVCRKS